MSLNGGKRTFLFILRDGNFGSSFVISTNFMVAVSSVTDLHNPFIVGIQKLFVNRTPLTQGIYPLTFFANILN